MSVYLDHAATTKVLPCAIAAATHTMETAFGNPSSSHSFGKEAQKALEEQRELIAATMGARAGELYFTSGGTESSNWAIAIARELGRRRGRHIITTAIEHACVLEPLGALEQEGYEVTYLAPDKEGRITAAQVAKALREDTILVSMMLVNNETGVRLPLEEVSQVLKEKNSQALLHSDAVQGFCKVPFTVSDLGVDLLGISAHKIGGVKGCGALYVREGLHAAPLILGGGQEGGLRSGTEATPQIAAFAAACQEKAESFEADTAYLRNLKAYALSLLSKEVPGLQVVSPGDAPHICALSLPGYPSEMLLRDLGDRGFFVSSGSACHKGKPSHVFAAMKLPPRVLMGMLRVSFSRENTREEIEGLCAALCAITRERIPMGR